MLVSLLGWAWGDEEGPVLGRGEGQGAHVGSSWLSWILKQPWRDPRPLWARLVFVALWCLEELKERTGFGDIRNIGPLDFFLPPLPINCFSPTIWEWTRGKCKGEKLLLKGW